MKGFLLDENLPSRIGFTPSLPVKHARELSINPTDAEIWEYARTHDLVIVSKDADFSHRILVSSPPPRVVHLRLGNLRLSQFHALLAKVWPEVEGLLQTHKLVNIYGDHLEAVAHNPPEH